MREVSQSNPASYLCCRESHAGHQEAIKRSAGVAPEVNLTEHTSCTPLPSANKTGHSGFETQRRHHGGISGPTKGHVSTKIFLKNSVVFFSQILLNIHKYHDHLKFISYFANIAWMPNYLTLIL